MSFNQLRLQQINSEWSARRVPYLSTRLGDGRRVGRFGGVLLLTRSDRSEERHRNDIGTTPKLQVLLTFPGSAWISQIRQQVSQQIKVIQIMQGQLMSCSGWGYDCWGSVDESLNLKQSHESGMSKDEE